MFNDVKFEGQTYLRQSYINNDNTMNYEKKTFYFYFYIQIGR